MFPLPSPLSPLPCLLPTAYCLLFLLFLAVPAAAQSIERPEFTGIRVGLGDRYKVGVWTPVELTLRGGSASLTGFVTLTVPDGDGIPSQVVTKPIQALAGRETVVRSCVRFGRTRSELAAEFIVDGKAAARRTFEPSLRADGENFLEAIDEQPLLVAVGNSTAGLEEAAKLRDSSLSDPNRLGAHHTEIGLVTDVERLPTHWYGYEGVDALLIAASDPEMFRRLAPGDARMKALDEWIRLGGRLILCVGAQADEALAPNSPLAGFAPGRLEKVVPLRQTAAWEQFCGSTAPVPQPKDGSTLSIPCAKLAVAEGIEARQDDLPLVVRTPRGLGQIVFVAADLDQSPFKKWGDRGLLVAKLLDFSLARENENPEDQYRGGYGYSDLAGQLRSALDNFTGVKVIPFALVAMMIVAYILLIGPGDYFLLKKILRRMEWTWFTFPILVAAVGLTAYWLAYYLKGDQLRVNQVDLVDVDVSTNTVRGTTWLNIFSPRMESFDLSLQPALPGKPGDDETPREKSAGYFAWLGLPGSGLGGMNPRGGDAALLSRPYRLWPDADLKPPAAGSLEGVPIQVWATKSFTGRWRTETKVVPRAELAEEQQDLVGSIANPYDFPLVNCYVAHDRWVYELGTIEPGATVRLGTHLKRNDLQNFLTGFHLVEGDKDAPRQATTPFEMYNRDPSYILRIMMFYEAAGGRAYTRLANDYQSFVDLSYLLKTNRAILWADAVQDANASKQGAILLRGDTPLARNEDRHAVIYRFVFPVKMK
ncbi:MAG: hypothetical protein IT426_09670 [Pirellulales bacterium]|nr:hypothetical protein [Pirellulales bacterium]